MDGDGDFFTGGPVDQQQQPVDGVAGAEEVLGVAPEVCVMYCAVPYSIAVQDSPLQFCVFVSSFATEEKG